MVYCILLLYYPTLILPFIEVFDFRQTAIDLLTDIANRKNLTINYTKIVFCCTSGISNSA